MLVDEKLDTILGTLQKTYQGLTIGDLTALLYIDDGYNTTDDQNEFIQSSTINEIADWFSEHIDHKIFSGEFDHITIKREAENG